MTFDRITKRDREERASEELAAALDALSSPMAERILGRAIQLDAADADKKTFGYDDLRAIAAEVGISEDALRKALLEEVDTDKDRTPDLGERLSVPRAVRGGIIVDGRPDAIQNRLEAIIRRLHAESERVVLMYPGKQCITFVLSVLVWRPTRWNRLTSSSREAWSHTASVDASRPSSA